MFANLRSVTQDPLERWLLRTWARLLPAHSVSPEDDFFDLGGRSVDAAKLFAAIHRRFGIDLPVSTLVDARTVRALARLLRQQATHANGDQLITVRRGGAKPPLVVVHGLRGNVLFAEPMATELGEDQPVFAIESDLLAGGPALLHTVEEMADSYGRLLDTQLDPGPVALFGASFGGFIALEMALRLEERGREVLLLAVGDTFLGMPSSVTGAMSIADRLALHRRRLARRSPLQVAAYVRDAIQARGRRLAGRATVWVSERRGAPLPRWLRKRHLEHVYTRARHLYRPRPYTGKVLLLRAAAVRPDWDRNWPRIATRSLKIVDIPCGHIEMTSPPHVQAVGRALQAEIDALLDEQAGLAAP